ncbi:uncharacterized protein LOC118433943 [Folsomia candida]|uniref:Odorant receptor n=1 Tax=Folsomia candida TaxID=158441 RepID=A0A226F6U4_FOLCA|nr:uncharacterized protein LOC118433943 [Folsomia candida]OXA64931.1 hypothetical protein Fcan01_00350 [Folsomia candida]
MDFFKEHVQFRLKNALLTKAYRMNLLTLEVLCAFCIVPFKISWEEEKVVEVRGKLRRTVTKCLYLFHLGRTVHFLVGFGLRMAGLQVGPSGEYVMSDKLLDYGWLGPILCTILFRFELTRKSKETVDMMNEAHKLEREAEKEGLNTVYTKGFFGKAWQVYTYSAYSCVFSVPMAAGMFSMLHPCEPAFISWQFLPCNSTTWVPSTDLEHRIIFTSGVIETFFWYQIISVGTLGNLATMFYLALSLKTFMVRAAKTKVSSFGEVTLNYYRRYQVYGTLMNYCMSHVITPAMICSWTSILILGWYTLLRYFGRVSFALSTIHAQLALNGMICLLTEFKSAGDAHEASLNLLYDWRYSIGKSKNLKLSKRWLKSCAPLKVRVGATNYFEKSTPMVIGSLCVEQVINLIMAEAK